MVRLYDLFLSPSLICFSTKKLTIILIQETCFAHVDIEKPDYSVKPEVPIHDYVGRIEHFYQSCPSKKAKL